MVEGRSLDTLCVLERACRDNAALLTLAGAGVGCGGSAAAAAGAAAAAAGIGEGLDMVDSVTGALDYRQSY